MENPSARLVICYHNIKPMSNKNWVLANKHHANVFQVNTSRQPTRDQVSLLKLESTPYFEYI